MLKFLRKKGVMKKFLWGVAIIVIIVFGFFGTAGLMQNGNQSYAGKVFNKEITITEFQKAYMKTRDQAYLRYGDNFEKIKDFLNLEAETWNRFILLHEAKKRGVKVSNKDIVDTITGYPFFQKDGTFDKEIYRKILKYVFNRKPRDFEEGIRESLIFEKLFDQETASISISDEEVYEDYKKENEKAKVSYVLIDPDSFINEATFTEEEAQQFYEDSKEDFRIPPTINVKYVDLTYPEDADNQKKAELDIKARAISDTLKDAPTLGLEEASKKYGDFEIKETGFFSIEKPNLKVGWTYETLQELFQAKEGDILEPIETQNGFLVAKIIKKRNTYIPNYAEASSDVQNSLINKKSGDLANNKAGEILKQIEEEIKDDSLDEFKRVSASLELKVEQTPLFNRGQYLPFVGLEKDFQEKAFILAANKTNKISDVVSTVKGHCILHLDEFVPIDEEKYKEEKDSFSERRLQEMKSEAFTDFIARIRLQAQLEDYLPKEKK